VIKFLPVYEAVEDKLRSLYLDDPRPWFVGFSGGKDGTMVLCLLMRAFQAVPADLRTKQGSVICNDTRVEIPQVVELVEGAPAPVQAHSDSTGLNLTTHLLLPAFEDNFWVNMIGGTTTTRFRTESSTSVLKV
jgi:DNA sulfur modification protein DndC